MYNNDNHTPLKKKVLLYNPKAVFFDMPLALLAIGSALDSEKYEVIIVDGRIEEDPVEIFKQHLQEAICFGVTALTGSPIKDALEVTRKIKDEQKELPVIWGGWHTSLFPEQTLVDEKTIDITVQGQGELTFIELVGAIEKKKPLNNVKGICYRSAKEGVVKTPPRIISPMDNFADINYELIDVEKYFEKKGQRQLDYISSTGCYFRCSFCADPFVYNRKWTAVSPEIMVNKLEELYEKYKFTDLNLQDETYFTYRDRVIEIAEGIIKRGLKFSWAATMRADQGSRLTEEDFKTCVNSGLRRLLIGVESGSQEMMDWLKKDIKLEQVYQCAERCKNLDVSVIFPFIVGFPEETDKSIEATVNVAKELNSMHHNFSTPIFYFKPYPGSKITEDVLKKGYVLPRTIEEWADFDYIGSSGPWVSQEKYDFFERFKFYLKLAYSKQRILYKPIQALAKLRCKHTFFKLPLEKKIADVLISKQQLS
ncbi:radical SAM protein [Aquimarina sp. RZ0]|uniref:B12-binding domain-containing radical SAM protein n=1 Tax=Aquimarina sp. RZ0 TaxID=2607730 RepID=UPI0011F1DD98|nr:radical SAM protein [Aquimarina sp. RZ0]KAA1244134.1 B12-binding domain-containing radical SAM protein [Aquimarina sp. RZ0]